MLAICSCIPAVYCDVRFIYTLLFERYINQLVLLDTYSTSISPIPCICIPLEIAMTHGSLRNAQMSNIQQRHYLSPNTRAPVSVVTYQLQSPANKRKK